MRYQNGDMLTNQIEVIISDLDGTLTNSQKHVTPYTREMIHRAMDEGCRMVLASGRPFFGVRKVIEELDLETRGGYVVSYNGGLVTELKTNKILYEKMLPEEVVLPIYNYVSQIKEVGIATYQPGYIYSEREKDEYLAIEAFGCRTPVTVVKHLPDIMENGIHKYVITGRPDVIPETSVKIKERFGNLVDMIISEPFFLEIVPKGINKAASLDILMKYLGCGRERVIAFGDGRNDVEMLEYAGISFAMENACEQAKEAATYITDTNDEDGIGKALAKFFADI